MLAFVLRRILQSLAVMAVVALIAFSLFNFVGDPDNFLATLLGCDAAKSNGSNVAKFCFQPYEDLIQKAKVVSNQAERQKLYEQAQVIFKEQAPWFTIAHAVQLKPIRKTVVDFKLSPFGRHNFYGVDIKE